MLVEVHSASPLADLKAEWLGQSLHFWRDGNQGNGRRVLLGVDFEQSSGRYPLTLAAQLENGERLACSALVSVQAGHFGVERLRVGPAAQGRRVARRFLLRATPSW